MSRPSGILVMPGMVFVGVRTERDEGDRVPDVGIDWEVLQNVSGVLQVIQGLEIPIREQLTEEMAEHTITKKELVDGGIDARCFRGRIDSQVSPAWVQAAQEHFLSGELRLWRDLGTRRLERGVGGGGRGRSCNEFDQK
ncbi:hypothetical protein K435DRAFT_970752 [Dendrothele bispora CBS 962.96]|uniref:Uncharacterized protein n=1 Tax=Dendrothele bispora (strain CBS 962.96) TaxID=1314807 RepID=A0A4S8L9X2_DENBC|nr:hypothetical protein K435DRAFT_970752 [Dendrothele bispora CBS 962.96]